MTFANLAGSLSHRVMYGRVHLSSDYAIEITLYDYDGVYATEVLWEPNLPTDEEAGLLAPQVEDAIAPYQQKALALGGLLKGRVK